MAAKKKKARTGMQSAARRQAAAVTAGRKPAAPKAAAHVPEKPAAAKEPEGKQKVFISQDDCYLFGQGTHYDIYKKLGAHPSVENGIEGMFFAVWAPNAAAVHVIGSFNGWNEDQYAMEKIGEIGIWTAFIPGIGENELYKYLIYTPDGRKIYTADP